MSRYHPQLVVGLTILCGLWTSAAAVAQTCEASGAADAKQLLWGDLHIHTAYSMDAYVFGTRRTPADAYRFARGEPERMLDGAAVQLDRPLDFAAVTDHAEYLAVTQICGVDQAATEYCRALNEVSAVDGAGAFRRFFLPSLMRNEPICPADAARCAAAAPDAWQRTKQAAESANEPCRFTTFIANEWSASPDNLHWHRNLIYAGSVVPEVPINSVSEPTQSDLWRALERRCQVRDGCDVLAIPHNSNLGMGGTFRLDEFDAESLRLRARFERLAEIFQHKGASECYPGAALADEMCDFEIVLPAPIVQQLAKQTRPLSEAEHAQIASGYLRPTLGTGLAVGARRGVNPLRYGFIGSTDTHGARAGYVEETDWQGTFSNYDGSAEKRAGILQYNPGGLVAIWAHANTRPDIFAALKRREVYATSGPRITLQFHQSFDPQADLCRPQPPDAIPMGGTLIPNSNARPRFAVNVLMDRRPIARVDIIKLVYRQGAIAHSTHTQSDLGRREWCVQWTDRDYNPQEAALWYARVFETPGPRWSAGLSQSHALIAERAWSSPIWSLPE